jgi:hypothetical protein
MDDPNALALFVAYYISRFDEEAYRRLGFETKKAAHESIARRLGVKASTVKNMRDEFDPIHDNPRKGWHKRPLRPSRQKVVEMVGELDERTLYEIVRDILEDASFRGADDVRDIVREIIEADATSSRESASPAARLRTGRMAENFFLEHYEATRQPLSGILHDTRLRACGYDFEIEGTSDTAYVEVKGTAGQSGGVLFTDKEWHVAAEMRDTYVVALVRNLARTPNIHFIWDPTAALEPRQRLYTTVRRSWEVTDAQLP